MSDTTTTAPARFPVCSICGDRNVRCDAWASWSEEDQDWVLETVFDAVLCLSCEETSDLTMVTEEEFRQLRCRYLNDRLRQGQGSGHDKVVITLGVTSVSDTFASTAIEAVAAFDNFTEDNDPHAEHDFGALEVEEQRLFFKLDYYNLTLDAHSPDKTDPAVTARVLTIMLAEEY